MFLDNTNLVLVAWSSYRINIFQMNNLSEAYIMIGGCQLLQILSTYHRKMISIALLNLSSHQARAT